MVICISSKTLNPLHPNIIIQFDNLVPISATSLISTPSKTCFCQYRCFCYITIFIPMAHLFCFSGSTASKHSQPLSCKYSQDICYFYFFHWLLSFEFISKLCFAYCAVDRNKTKEGPLVPND